MFTAGADFFDWIAMVWRVGRIKIKYDAAIRGLEKRRKQVRQAVTKNFETMYTLSDSIQNAQIRVVSSQKAANGAADYYSDDPENKLASRHRQVGVASLSKSIDLEKRIQEWSVTRTAIEKTQLELQQADIDIEERLSFLKLEKLRAVAALKAVYHETAVYKRENGEDLDPLQSRHLDLLREYHNQHQSIRAMQQFMKTDPLDPYRRRADGFNPASPSQRFDEAVRQRTRKVVDLVVRE